MHLIEAWAADMVKLWDRRLDRLTKALEEGTA